MSMSRNYEIRIMEAVLKAIFEGSMIEANDGSKTIALMTAEIVEALITIQAVMLATSPSVSMPNALRKCCDELAKGLFQRTHEMRANPNLYQIFDEVRVIQGVH